MARKKKANKEVEAVYEEIEDSKKIDEEVDSEEEVADEETEEELEEESEEIEDEDDDSEDDDEDEDDSEDDDEDDSEDDDEEEEEVEEEEPTYENPIRRTMSDKTKYILIGVVGVLIVILCILIAVKDEKPNNAVRNANTEFLQEFYKKYDEKSANVIFFESATCGFCTMQKPIIKNIADDYKMDYYDIDASTLSDNELSEVISALGIQGATPTTVVVKDGKVVATNEGYLDGKELVEFFVTNKVLPSDATYKQEERIVPVTYSKFKDIVKKKDASLVLIDQSACSSCTTVRSLLNKLGEKNNFKVNYLNAAYLTQEEGNNFVDKDLKDMGYKADAYKKDKTVNIPLLLIVKDGKIKDYVLQKTEESDYTKVLKKHGFIK